MYIVLEIQSDGKISTVISDSYATRNEAESKYFTILAAAATSEIPIHSAVMLTHEGYLCKSDSFDHRENKEQ